MIARSFCIRKGVRIPALNSFSPRLIVFNFSTQEISTPSQISSSIKKLNDNRSWAGIIEIVRDAIEKNIPLPTRDYIVALNACSLQPNESSQLGFELFSQLQQRETIPILAFYKIMEICSLKYIPNRNETPDHSKKALEIVNLFNKKNLVSNAEFYTHLLVTLSRSKDQFMEREIEKYYSKWIQLLEDSKGSFHSVVAFTGLLQYFSNHSRNQEWVSRIFRDMSRLNISVSFEYFSYLMDESLTKGTSSQLLLLADYYLKIYAGLKLDAGQIHRLIHVAASRGSPDLAEKGFELLYSHNYPSTPAHHACRVKAYIQHRNFLGALQSLCQSEAAGIKFDQALPGSEQSFAQDLAMTLGKSLSRSLTDIDDLYYLCVDLVPRSVPVPKVVLDSILIACAFKGHLDRSFATFQEFPSLFNVSPDAFSFNCLLLSISQSRNPTVPTILKVFQSMQQKEINPNGQSLSFLLDTILITNDLAALHQVATMAREQRLSLNRKTLRKVALSLAKQGKWEEVEEVRKMMVFGNNVDSSSSSSTVEISWPHYFKDRLKKILVDEKNKSPPQIETPKILN